MPGTIKVSVLDLMDLPPSDSEENTNLLSLKAVMGKREYQTMGKGDFSFPVVSLRENLIVMLHDKEGNVVFRAEFKTMSVVEKGVWDILFPLEGGGRVHMKLQFLLSDEERGRIREVRDSALKKKHGELLKGGLKSSVSGQKFGGLIPLPNNELVSTGALVNQSEQTQMNVENPLCAPSLQKLEERSEGSFGQAVPRLNEVSKEAIKIQPPPDDIQKWQISSKKCLDPHIERPRSLILGNDTAVISFTSVEVREDLHSPKRKNLHQRSLSRNIRKMISAFENNISQGPEPHAGSRTKSQASRTDIDGSMKRVSLKESDTKQVKFRQTMPKSFSSGMLSDINSQQNPKFFRSLVAKKQEDMAHIDHDTKWETTGKHNLLVDIKTGQNLKNLESGSQKTVKVKDFEASSGDTLDIPESHSSKGTNTVLRPIETEEHVSEREDPVCFEVKQDPSIISTHRDPIAFTDKMEAMPSSYNSKDTEAFGAKDSSIGKANRSGDRADEDVGTSKQNVANYHQLYHEVNLELNKEHTVLEEEDQLSREMHAESTSIDEPCSLSTYQHGSASGRSDSVEQTASTTPHETAELSTFSDYEKCPFRSLGIWIPRYLCITSGSKQLRNFVECCDIRVGTHRVEKSLSGVEANEQS